MDDYCTTLYSMSHVIGTYCIIILLIKLLVGINMLTFKHEWLHISNDLTIWRTHLSKREKKMYFSILRILPVCYILVLCFLVVYFDVGGSVLQPTREHVGLAGGSRPPEPASMLPREDGSSGYGSPDSDSLEAQWHPHTTPSSGQDLTKRHLLHLIPSASTLNKWLTDSCNTLTFRDNSLQQLWEC